MNFLRLYAGHTLICRITAARTRLFPASAWAALAPADNGLKESFSHIRACHHDLFGHHHRGNRRQVQWEILLMGL
jgi:hypothetical protein